VTFRVNAVFRDGKFDPQTPCDLAEGTLVQLVVETAVDGVSIVPNGECISQELLQSLTTYRWDLPVLQFSREELHERR
jgi:hypothetical protein